MKITTNDNNNQRESYYVYDKYIPQSLSYATIPYIRNTFNITAKSFLIVKGGKSSFHVKQYSDGTSYTCDIVLIDNNKGIGYKYNGDVYTPMYYIDCSSGFYIVLLQ